MHTPFDKITGQWKIDWPGRVSRHDLVYLSLPDDPMTGLILGNGDVGVLCYVDGSKVIFVINRSDLWDDSEIGVFNSAAFDEEERHTTLRHGGRIMIDFRVPVFDLIYLSDFNGRLSIAEGRLEMNASGPFGSINIGAFVCYDSDIMFCAVETELADTSIPVEVTIERFGSRMFHRWYNQVNPDASLGLPGTESHVADTGGFIFHRLTSGSFALGCSVKGPDGEMPGFSREGHNRVKSSFSGRTATAFELVCGITGPVDGDPVALAEEQINSVITEGKSSLLETTKRSWKSFWLRSLMECGDDFLDNLWHLVMYYSNASQRGKFPGRFCGYLWNWQRDFQAWGFYFHFNQQQVYWPLNAAGHHDLVDSYLNMRFHGLEHGREDAVWIFGVKGAVVSDVTERRGYNSKSEFHNHTPVAQIAMDFWKQYLYTGNIDFLEDRALPYMIEASCFFSSLFEQGTDGFYHAKSGSGYEGGPLMRDVISEVVTARVFFPAVLQALEIAGRNHPDCEIWLDISENLAPLQTIEQPEDVIEKKDGGLKIQKGLFKGKDVPGNRTFSAGWGIKEKRLMTSFAPQPDNELAVHTHPMWLLKGLLSRLVQKGDFESTYGPVNPDAWIALTPETSIYNDKIFPGVELSSVFPSGYIGLSQKNTDEYSTAVTTAKLFANDMHGWVPFGVMLARLGLGNELSHILDTVYKMEPIQVNGTGVDSSGLAGEYAGPEAPLDLRSSLARYTDGSGRFPNQTKSFRFLTIHSSLANVMNEMLLQSHDGIIRVAPAVDGTRSARFTLHAVGGFVVSAEIKTGNVLWVGIQCNRGGLCQIENPWTNAAVFRNDTFEKQSGQPIIPCDNRAGDMILLLTDRKAFDDWKTTPVRYEPNTREKRCSVGKNILGMPRTF